MSTTYFGFSSISILALNIEWFENWPFWSKKDPQHQMFKKSHRVAEISADPKILEIAKLSVRKYFDMPEIFFWPLLQNLGVNICNF